MKPIRARATLLHAHGGAGSTGFRKVDSSWGLRSGRPGPGPPVSWQGGWAISPCKLNSSAALRSRICWNPPVSGLCCVQSNPFARSGLKLVLLQRDGHPPASSLGGRAPDDLNEGPRTNPLFESQSNLLRRERVITLRARIGSSSGSPTKARDTKRRQRTFARFA